MEQMLYIGFAEEVFYRGYFMTRQCQWLGKYPGLLVTSFIFGLGHILSRIADHGSGYFLPAVYTGLQTFFGGLIFGLIYVRTKNIWSAAILHVSTNMYLQDLIAYFTP
jgi:membrane protease YdiL (CAAX protease family)